MQNPFIPNQPVKFKTDIDFNVCNAVPYCQPAQLSDGICFQILNPCEENNSFHNLVNGGNFPDLTSWHQYTGGSRAWTHGTNSACVDASTSGTSKYLAQSVDTNDSTHVKVCFTIVGLSKGATLTLSSSHDDAGVKTILITITEDGTYCVYYNPNPDSLPTQEQLNFEVTIPTEISEGASICLSNVSEIAVDCLHFSFDYSNGDTQVISTNDLNYANGRITFCSRWKDYLTDSTGCFNLKVLHFNGETYPNLFFDDPVFAHGVDDWQQTSDGILWTGGTNSATSFIADGVSESDLLYQELSLPLGTYTVGITETTKTNCVVQLFVNGDFQSDFAFTAGYGSITFTTTDILLQAGIKIVPISHDSIAEFIMTDFSLYSEVETECYDVQKIWDKSLLFTASQDNAGFNIDFSLLTLYMRLESLLREPKYLESSQDVWEDRNWQINQLFSETLKVKTLVSNEVPEYVHDAMNVFVHTDNFTIKGTRFIKQKGDIVPQNHKESNLASVILQVAKAEQFNRNNNC